MDLSCTYLLILLGRGCVHAPLQPPMGATPLNSEKIPCAELFYHKVYVPQIFLKKQRFEAHTFDGLCTNGPIS